jgi:hypothetical protein
MGPLTLPSTVGEKYTDPAKNMSLYHYMTIFPHLHHFVYVSWNRRLKQILRTAVTTRNIVENIRYYFLHAQNEKEH